MRRLQLPKSISLGDPSFFSLFFQFLQKRQVYIWSIHRPFVEPFLLCQLPSSFHEQSPVNVDGYYALKPWTLNIYPYRLETFVFPWLI